LPGRPENSRNHFLRLSDYPGAIDTEATGITPSGEIVGRYISSDGFLHGFLLSKGNFYPINVPKALGESVNDINPSGQVVGAYLGQDGIVHGYVLRDRKYTTIDYPGASYTSCDGIGADGEIVGEESGQDGLIHGFLLDKKGMFTLVEYPGAPQSLLTQISAGRMIGDYLPDPSTVYAFVVKNGRFQSFGFPGCKASYVSGLNPEGDIVGGCIRNFLDEDGYLRSNGQFISIKMPGWNSCFANDINPQGQIVGRYSINDGRLNHGFLLTWK